MQVEKSFEGGLIRLKNLFNKRQKWASLVINVFSSPERVLYDFFLTPDSLGYQWIFEIQSASKEINRKQQWRNGDKKSEAWRIHFIEGWVSIALGLFLAPCKLVGDKFINVCLRLFALFFALLYFNLRYHKPEHHLFFFQSALSAKVTLLFGCQPHKSGQKA